MPPAPYPDFRWIFRSLRALPVVAMAALIGGIIGGFSVFALDLALTAPPNHDAGAETGKINTERAVSAAATAPAAGTSAPPMPEQAAAEDEAPGTVAAPQPELRTQDTAQTQTDPQIAVTPPPPQQATWPDALSRKHQPAPATMTAPAAAPTTAVSAASQPAAPQPATQSIAPQAAAPPPAMAASRQAPVAQAARAADSTSDQPANSEIARKPHPTKRYLAVKRNSERTASDAAEASTRTGRPVYDSYGRSDAAGPPDVRAKHRDTDRRYSVRRERAGDDDDRSADGYGEQSDRGSAMPPQPPPPLFFGLFGGGDRYGDQ